MYNFMSVIKALADENRVRTLMVLRNGELCVCEIIEFLCLAPSTVSKHMSILKQARLVESRKEGRWVYYKLAQDDTIPEALSAISWVTECLMHDRIISEDDRRIKGKGLLVCEGDDKV
jgi:ArsR family transcriptional regulator, arsenate/arsenite/antimonite-responsive transcriptional repressor